MDERNVDVQGMTTPPPVEDVSQNIPVSMDELKQQYEKEGSVLHKVTLSTGKLFIVRQVNKALYRSFQQSQVAPTVIDPMLMILEFFVIEPMVDSDVFDALLPGEVDMLCETILALHGYSQPLVEVI